MKKPKEKLVTMQDIKLKAKKVMQVLNARYVVRETLLNASNAWELLVATRLAAQCTDARVNLISPALFERFPSVENFANAELEEVESLVKSTGFYHNKAKDIINSAKEIVEKHNKQVPKTMEELVKLPGIGRKTANCILCGAFGISEGIAVDTHVKRIVYRLGLTKETQPVPVEKDLLQIFEKSEWSNVNNKMVCFGREICKARKPLCEECEMQLFCSKIMN